MNDGRSGGQAAAIAALSPPAVLDRVARLVVQKQVLICEQMDRINAPSVFDDKKDAPAEAPPASGPASAKKLTWIEIEVIDDDTEEPINNVRMAVKTPDGNESFYTTNPEGLIRIDDIEPGTCDARCETKEATRTDTLRFIKKGEKTGKKSPSKTPPLKPGTYRILNVADHKVKAGESLGSIASGAELKESELEKFNFGTDDPEQLNEYLADVVGSTKTDADGNYLLDDTDKPGIVLVHSKWEEDGLATTQRHTFRVKPIPDVRRLWLIEMEHLHFHFDSAVLLADYSPGEPDAEIGADERVTAISVLGEALQEANRHPERKMLIAGHTDTSGSAQYNLPLSQQRADSVLAALTGDRKKWVQICQVKHKVEDYQLILKWVARDRGWDCDPGEVDNKPGPKTTAGIKGFQKQYNIDFSASIAEDGLMGPETWGAIFDVYMDKLADLLDLTDSSGLESKRSALSFVDDSKKSVGCGENFPKDHRGVDNWRSAENRRVEILFFLPDQLPTMDCHSGGKCTPAVCVVNDPKQYVPMVIPVPPHPGTPVGPLILRQSSSVAVADAEPSGGSEAAALQDSGGGDSGTTTADKAAKPVTPSIAGDLVLERKKDTNNPKRQELTLKTDEPFDGTGTFTRSKDNIDFYTAETGGTKIAFDGTGNVFTGAVLTAGTKVYAEGAKVSDSMNDITLTLALSGGTKKVKPPATAKATVVDVVLDICLARKDDKTDPVVMAADKKLAQGRILIVQDPDFKAQRAKVIVRRALPKDFKGKLVLSVAKGRVKLFEEEKAAKAQKAVKLPLEIANDTIDETNGKILFAEGAVASEALRDGELKLEIKGHAEAFDKVATTVVEFLPVKCDDHFAPSQEKEDITYKCKGVALLTGEKIFMEISSEQYDKNPIFSKELSDDEKKDGEHKFEFDGKANCKEGDLKDEAFIHPLLSPYKVRFKVDESYTKDLEFKVLYHSITIHQGPWTPDEAEPPDTEKSAFAQYKLNELGYYGGPVKNDTDDYLKKAVIRYKANHKTLHELNYASYNDTITADLITALKAKDNPRPFNPGDALADKSKSANIPVEALTYEAGEFNAAKAPKEKDRLNRPLIPAEVDILLKKKDDTKVLAPDAVGPVRISWKWKDADEDLSPQYTSTAAEPSKTRKFIEKALKLEGGRAGKGDDCHKKYAGVREGDADNYAAPFLLGTLYTPYEAKKDTSNKVVFCKACVDKKKFPKRMGKAGVYLRLSYVSGDDFQFSAEIDFTDLKNKDDLEKAHKIKDEASKIKAETGTFTIRRFNKVAVCIQWPARTNDHEWGKIQTEFAKSFLDVDVGSITTKKITDVLTEAQYKAIVTANTAHTDPTKITLNDDAIVGVALPAQGAMNAAAYRTALKQFVNDNYWDKINGPLRVQLSTNIRKDFPVGFIICEFLTHKPVNIQKAPPGDTTVVSANTVLWTFSIGLPDSTIFADQKDPDKVYYVVSHEMGHNFWLHHWEHSGGIAAEHDTDDHNCLMSYSSSTCAHANHRPGIYTPHFCGKCNLKLRGWDIDAAGFPADST